MEDIVLSIKDVSKQYRLGEVGTGTLSHDLNRWWYKIRGLDDPYLLVGSVNNRASDAIEDYVWALRDISFDVKRGEVLGIIGKNGAGKSTLLKLLSQVTNPTTGHIGVKGRIASLLEVGTGFHPELTGRENIFLNGAILGMTKTEIRLKLDEIIAFAGVAKYIDTPVKRYSSGMKVRLGFAVAAHLEPEILVVDEVLAVGDAEFQKKAIGKMQDVSKDGGRTVLFVSHNMSSVRNLCTSGVLLEDGRITYQGAVDATIDKYLFGEGREKQNIYTLKESNLSCYFRKISMKSEFDFSDNIDLDFEICINESRPDYTVGFLVFDFKGNCILVSTYDENGLALIDSDRIGDLTITASIPHKILKPGSYSLTVTLRTLNGSPIHKVNDVLGFSVSDTHTYRGLKSMYRSSALVAPEIKWLKAR